jgi:hypothetical protein
MKWALDEVGPGCTGLDEVGLDEVGPHPYLHLLTLLI